MLENSVETFDMDPSAFENIISDMDVNAVDEFKTSMNFEKFIVLSKKELSNFCRLTEPLTKSSVDDYGKSVFVNCLNETQVELVYTNNPFYARMIVENKSGKMIKPFAVLINNLKKIVTNSFASLVLVEDEKGDINLALCESLLFLETKNLSESFYKHDFAETTKSIDKELAAYTFKKVGSILNQTERASEKVIVIKNNKAIFNTGIFTSKSKSPFEDDNFVIFKQVSDVLATLTDLSKVSLSYSLTDKLIVNCDNIYYIECPVGLGTKVDEFLSPIVDQVLTFDANISVINDTFLRLISIVKSLDYLSDIVTIEFSETQMKLVIASNNQSRTSTYSFDIVEGKPDVIGNIKLTVDVLQVFLNIVGTDVKYAFTNNGLGIENDTGSFMIRKSH